MTATSEATQRLYHGGHMPRVETDFDAAGTRDERQAVYRAMLDARAVLDAGADENEDASAAYRCVAFRVAEELYVVDLGTVCEVILPPVIVPVPGADRDVLGVINLRGNVVTIINSRAKLGLSGCPEGAATRILVLEDGSGYVGALVDTVEDIVHVRVDDLEPVRGTSRPQVEVGGALTIGTEIAFVIHAKALVGIAES